MDAPSRRGIEGLIALPAFRLPLEQSQRVEKFAVNGQYVEDDNAVRHLALLAESVEIASSVEVPVFHQSPPLKIGQHGHVSKLAPDIIAWLEDFTDDEAVAIETWLERIRPFVIPNALAQYRIRECNVVRRDPDTNRTELLFSCVGFVSAAYESAGIFLLVEPNQWPGLSREALKLRTLMATATTTLMT